MKQYFNAKYLFQACLLLLVAVVVFSSRTTPNASAATCTTSAPVTWWYKSVSSTQDLAVSHTLAFNKVIASGQSEAEIYATTYDGLQVSAPVLVRVRGVAGGGGGGAGASGGVQAGGGGGGAANITGDLVQLSPGTHYQVVVGGGGAGGDVGPNAVNGSGGDGGPSIFRADNGGTTYVSLEGASRGGAYGCGPSWPCDSNMQPGKVITGSGVSGGWGGYFDINNSNGINGKGSGVPGGGGGSSGGNANGSTIAGGNGGNGGQLGTASGNHSGGDGGTGGGVQVVGDTAKRGAGGGAGGGGGGDGNGGGDVPEGHPGKAGQPGVITLEYVSGGAQICETPVMSGTLLPTNSTCTVLSGASNCTQTLTWTTTNPVGTSAVTSVVGTPSPANGNNGSQLFTTRYNPTGTYFFLYNNSQKLAEAVVRTQCAADSVWDGTICKPNGHLACVSNACTWLPGSGANLDGCTAVGTACNLPAMSGTLLPADSTCTIPLGGNNCTQTLAWTTTNPQGTSAVTSQTGTPGNVSGNAGSQLFTAPHNDAGVYFFLYNNAVELAQAVVRPVCATGTVWGGTSCVASAVNATCGGTHYMCSTGTSANNVDGSTRYTWDCQGGNGGSNASCSENKAGACPNGAINPPDCTMSNRGCINNATNPPRCTVDPNGLCLNRATNPPGCTNGGNGNTPPLPPPPTVSLTLNPTTIYTGASSTLTWTSAGATSCTGTNFSNGGTFSGSLSVSPLSTITYTLTCSNTGGSSSANATITVKKKPIFIEN